MEIVKNHASVCSGYGAAEIAAARLGWNNMFCCEIDSHCRNILSYYNPNTIIYGDIHNVDFRIWRGKLDILTGGFPCQDFSYAGIQSGLLGKQGRIYFEMLRATDETRVPLVIWENVPGVRKYLPTIIQTFAEIGYSLSWHNIRASWFGLPHERERVFGVAFNSDCFGLEEIQIQARIIEKEIYKASKREFSRATSRQVQLENYAEFLRMDDGVSSGVCAAQIHAYGNSIVPEIIYTIFKSLTNENKNS